MKLIDEKEVYENGMSIAVNQQTGFRLGASFAEQKLLPMMVEFLNWAELNYSSRTFPDKTVLWSDWRTNGNHGFTTEQLLEQFIKKQNEMKLEIKHLVSYLPYGLECYGMGEATPESEGTDDEKPQLFKIEGMNNTWVEVSGRLETVTDEIHIEDCIPHLLPLSALTEPMEDGSVPIVELAKMNGFTPHNYFIELQNDTIVLYGEQFNHPEERLTAIFFFELDIDNCNMNKGIEFKDNAVESVFSPLREQVKSFEYLFSNHFDVYGLLDANLAIDKRTLK